jgi:hypothetical protein
MKTLAFVLTLALATPAFAAPRCDAYSYCAGSEARIWEQTYTAAFVFFSEDRGYDDNTAAGLAEGVADRALTIYRKRHSK